MARPKKTGLDYFPKDVDTWDDYKIMDLVNEYGPLGYCIYDIARDEVYKNGYYLEVPLDRLAVLIIRKIGNRWVKDKNLVLQVILYCADIGLFDNALLTQSVITSVGIQRRYSEVTVRNKVDKTKYWLLEKNDVQAALESIPENCVSAAKTRVNDAKTSVSAVKKPQKKMKENKSKVNEREAAKPPSPPTPIEVADYVKEKGYHFNPERFYNYYAAMGWERHGEPIKDWRRNADNWELQELGMNKEIPVSRASSFDVDELEGLSAFND